ncbi:hypothetical protein MKW98_002541 [Papaver atlanticum]|uniref:Uncharacterized protein n=1 Tax=Papaver atlanticum TaxID=357466 RepID=A0AAD4SBL3_9MAGN|nr:hypothetical protein MKW98_002541 [Papaver atlanticum]
MVGVPYTKSQRWGYVRIITGTILGGVLGFYVMYRLEISHKEKMKKRLIEYEKEKEKRMILKGDLESEFAESDLS